MKKLKCASFFAGVGGIDLGFEQTGKFEVIYANELESAPAQTYALNSAVMPDVRDIRSVLPEEIPEIDVILGGFPCQAFSIAGKMLGFEDKTRGTLFFEIVRLVKEKQPSVIFLENVKNLVSHDHGNTFKVIQETLQKLGYHVFWKVMNACEYGNIPQNRERIYIVCFKEDIDFKFPEQIPLTTKLSDVIDFEHPAADRYYYTKGKFHGDIYEKLIEAMDDPDTVYQWRRVYVRKNKSGLIPTLTANMGSGGHNVGLVKTKYGIRKLTPRECFQAQGFPSSFILPETMSDGKLYQQAGNSVCVPVINRIADSIADSLSIW